MIDPTLKTMFQMVVRPQLAQFTVPELQAIRDFLNGEIDNLIVQQGNAARGLDSAVQNDN